MDIDKENFLIRELANIIDQSKHELRRQVNSTITLVYWQVGVKINTHILENKRGEYAKEIVSTVSTQLKERYGKSFELRNLRRMMQFSELFPDLNILVPLSSQLSWSHFVELLTLKNKVARDFYAHKISEGNWSIRETRKQIERKAFERKEIANLQLTDERPDLQNTFKDPYFLDFLGLKDGYLENDLESAILKELELFILEMGTGFAFVERQKRMIIDGEDFYLDLLFFHRKLKRLVAIELKLGKFKASNKGQMELYLKWLDKHERQAGEESPIGLILCAEKSQEQIELLEMGKDGIMVAEYWTELPPKNQLEAKLHSAFITAQENIKQRNAIGP
jgi:predicted nuclease of restriction endonuclease-like (RecB) superfamily